MFALLSRHVLLNGSYGRLILKMCLLSVICDGYVAWASLPSAGEFFEQEFQFYAMCFRASLGRTDVQKCTVEHRDQ